MKGLFPRVFLRVGANGTGHTRFINDLAETCHLKVFTKHSISPKKFANGVGNLKFCEKVDRYQFPKMIAFDNVSVKHMCSPSSILHGFSCDHTPNNIDAIVFSINDKGKLGDDIDLDGIIRHVFGKNSGHLSMLYKRITEIHHMVKNNKVRVLASMGKRLHEPIILSHEECIDRVKFTA
jgi:hypothetical protein